MYPMSGQQTPSSACTCHFYFHGPWLAAFEVVQALYLVPTPFLYCSQGPVCVVIAQRQQREPGTWDALTWEQLCFAPCKMAPSPLKHRGIVHDGGWLQIQPLKAQMTGLAKQHMTST